MIIQLKKALKENHLSVDDSTCEKLIHYLDALCKWNKVINLTSIIKPHDVIYLHIIDSLLITPFLKGTTLLDVGTGAGLPGLPLALTLPQTKWVLLDKNAKKTRFLLQMQAELDMTNIEIVTTRTEDFRPIKQFDSIVTRAYGSMRLLTESTKQLLSEHGTWLFMKGRYPNDELNDLPNFVKLQAVNMMTMCGMKVERHLISCTLATTTISQ